MPITVVSKILGHGSISTTLNIYAHVLAEHMEKFELQRARILGTKRHLRQVKLQKSGKSRNINDAGWSSLVARRAHNPEVVGSNPTPATNSLPTLVSAAMNREYRADFLFSGRSALSGRRSSVPFTGSGQANPTPSGLFSCDRRRNISYLVTPQKLISQDSMLGSVNIGR